MFDIVILSNFSYLWPFKSNSLLSISYFNVFKLTNQNVIR